MRRARRARLRIWVVFHWQCGARVVRTAGLVPGAGRVATAATALGEQVAPGFMREKTRLETRATRTASPTVCATTYPVLPVKPPSHDLEETRACALAFWHVRTPDKVAPCVGEPAW